MRTLEFIGKVRSNKGKFHKDMVIPGRMALGSAPAEWPTQLIPGTLNVGIDENGFPSDLDGIGKSDRVRKFDEGNFKPAFVIAQEEIIGNTMKPKDGQPLRGTAQVWQTELCNLSTGATVRCWMLRRVGSGISAQIELVSEYHLREHLGLSDGTSVKVTILEG